MQVEGSNNHFSSRAFLYTREHSVTGSEGDERAVLTIFVQHGRKAWLYVILAMADMQQHMNAGPTDGRTNYGVEVEPDHRVD